MASPNWSDFRVILALKDEGSVAGAARILAVDGSTVSRRLAAAEQVFGTTLIIRGGGAFTFTPEGLVIADAAKKMDAVVNEARTRVSAMRQQPTGTVRIACVPTAAHVLRPLVSKLSARHEGLNVDIISSIAACDLAKGEADIAVRTRAPTHPGLVIAYSFTWGRCLYASKTYFQQNGRPNEPVDLRDHTLVRIGTGNSPSKPSAFLDRFDNPERPCIRVDNTDSARLMIEQGAGIGALFCAFADAHPTIERVFPDPFDQTDSWVIYHESARGSQRMRIVLDALVAFLKENRALLTGLD
ncbi:LysR family transcriptional regulator [uncultured Roseobacter sp.]|uniref:LysR family transcriptional regulator n=1 Tax=uncultured Roseobacter sp. TaxID=114847 RepID=UPI0026022CCF|nr:LysR family transcriptional regulator [uncultured Roseobacter sp.]